MIDDPEKVINAWLDGEIRSEDIGLHMHLSPGQAFRVRRAARMAALRAYHRILASRENLTAMALGRSTEDLTDRALKAWISGELAAVHAAELIGTTVDGLDLFARQHGLLPKTD